MSFNSPQHRHSNTLHGIRGRTGWLATTALALLMLGIFALTTFLQHNFQLTKERVQYVKPFRVGHLPSGKYIKVAAFGYDTFLAHALWLRAIQSFGGLFRSSNQQFTQILSQFDVITDLEPRFFDAYDFGALVIGEEARDTTGALTLLEKGMLKNPRRYYRLALDASFQSGWNGNDYQRAIYYIHMAQKCVDCPDWVASWEIALQSKMGRGRLAFEKWFQDYLQQLDQGNEFMSSLRAMRAKSQLRDIGLELLNDALNRFNKDQGRQAKSFDELLANQYLKDQEVYGWPRLMSAIQFYQQRGEKLYPHMRQILDSGIVKGNVLPENPLRPQRGYLLFFLDGKAYAAEDIEGFCREWLTSIREQVRNYQKANGHFPAKLTDVPQLLNEQGKLHFVEPEQGEWSYDPQTGEVKSPTFPDL